MKIQFQTKFEIIMAVPRHKHTRSSVGQRRMHIFIAPPTLTTCQKCKKTVKPHTICQYCGYYKGREFINILGKLNKKEKKLREKEIKTVEKEGKKDKDLSVEELSQK